MASLLPRIGSLLTSRFSAPLAPEAPHYVVGDIHGRADLLDDLVEMIEADAILRGLRAYHLVFLGDYIDRGPDSRGVIDRLIRLSTGPRRAICLKGNHEAMLLDFLDHPERGNHWLRNGGMETAESYLDAAPDWAETPEAATQLASALTAAMGPAHLDFLRGLRLSHRSGNLFVAHAGAEPSVPIEAQSEEVLLWWRPGGGRAVRSDGVWVLHGHTIVPEPQVINGRIAIDTGAYATDRLTVAFADRDTLEFMSTGHG